MYATYSRAIYGDGFYESQDVMANPASFAVTSRANRLIEQARARRAKELERNEEDNEGYEY